MAIKILFLILFCMSCGKQVTISNQLETAQALSTQSYEKNGVLIKGDPSKVQVNGQNLEVSKFSSKMAFDFIASVPPGTPIPVVFTGGISSNQVVLEKIRRQ